MLAPRRSWTLAGVPLAILIVGCTSAGVTPPPSVTVHVVNGISNVVLMSKDLSAAVGLGTLAPDTQSLLAACGGTADVQAPIKNGNGGLLVLLIDPSGELDHAYARGDGQSNSTAYPVEIIWSNGELNSGDWIVVQPGGVTRTTTAPAAPPSGSCAAWIGEPQPS
jgi:hypothetical protein